ncbi:hypothetical protein ACT7DA_00670 [Bacillus pacificus]
MEVKGVKVDTERLRNMGVELAGRLKEMEQKFISWREQNLILIHRSSLALFCLRI